MNVKSRVISNRGFTRGQTRLSLKRIAIRFNP